MDYDYEKICDSLEMELRKTIPAQTKTIKARWCKKDFLEMSQGYRKIRARCGSPMDDCHWCKHKFIDGEMMALASFEKIGNKMLCQDCAKELMKTKGETNDRRAN